MNIHPQRDSNIRHIQVIRNGTSSQKPLLIQLKQNANRLIIQNKLQSSWLFKNDNITELRLYDQHGVELFDEDIAFIKEGQIIYASIYGEDFDSNCGLAQYKIIKQLSQGSQGKMFLAKHRITQQKVAIKYVDKRSIGNAEDIDIVFRQVELLKQIRHPNIVKILNCFILQSMEVVYVMEYLQGGRLVDYIAKYDRLSEDQARSYFFQIANAVQYCHFQNIIHKDLSLENILFADEEFQSVKLFNFSLSKTASEKPSLQQLKYMAPEQVMGKPIKQESKIDVWALGILLYSMVFGVLPFDADDKDSLIENIKNVHFLYPQEDGVSLSLQDLLSKIFVVDPKARIDIQGILTHQWTLGTMLESFKKTHHKAKSSTFTLNLPEQSMFRMMEDDRSELQLSPIIRDLKKNSPTLDESPKSKEWCNLNKFLNSPLEKFNLKLITDDTPQQSSSRTSRAAYTNTSKQALRSVGLTDRSEISQKHQESKNRILDSPIFNKNFSKVLEKYQHTTRSFILTKQKLQSITPSNISSPLSQKSVGRSNFVSGKGPIQKIFTYDGTKDTDSVRSDSPSLSYGLSGNDDPKNKVYKTSTFRVSSKHHTTGLQRKE